MKTFLQFLTDNVNTLDTLKDPGIRSYYSRHRVTPDNRRDFETIRKIILITLEAGPTARRRLKMLLDQLATTTVPEIRPLVSQLGAFTAQDSRDAAKLFSPEDIEKDLVDPEEAEEGQDPPKGSLDDDDAINYAKEREQG